MRRADGVTRKQWLGAWAAVVQGAEVGLAWGGKAEQMGGEHADWALSAERF